MVGDRVIETELLSSVVDWHSAGGFSAIAINQHLTIETLPTLGSRGQLIKIHGRALISTINDTGTTAIIFVS